jgi:two-component system, chemotaxis family, chemotaxis protein CheY
MNSQTLKALVVGARLRTRQITALRLKEMGFDVMETESAQSLQLLLSSHRPQLVVTDWDIPGLKGLRLLDQLGPRERDVFLFTEEDLGDYGDLLQRTSVKAWFHRREELALMEKIKKMMGSKKADALGLDPSPRKIILLIENSTDLRDFLKLTLLRALPRAFVREAVEGGQVLSELTHNPIDFIFLDLDMPTMDGRAFLKMVHGDPRLSRKPIVVLAERITPELLKEFQQDPAVWFIEKPAQAEEITEVIGRFLRRDY